jgi:hypothetical protein
LKKKIEINAKYKKPKMLVFRLSEEEHQELLTKSIKYSGGNMSLFLRCALAGWRPNRDQLELMELIQDAECKYNVLKTYRYRKKLLEREQIKKEVDRASQALRDAKATLLISIEQAKEELRKARKR